MNFPSTHYLKRPPTAVGNADVILGMELTDYWGDGEYAISTMASTASAPTARR